MQDDLNGRTIALHGATDVDDASEAQLQQLKALAEDQSEIERLTWRLTENARQPH